MVLRAGGRAHGPAGRPAEAGCVVLGWARMGWDGMSAALHSVALRTAHAHAHAHTHAQENGTGGTAARVPNALFLALRRSHFPMGVELPPDRSPPDISSAPDMDRLIPHPRRG